MASLVAACQRLGTRRAAEYTILRIIEQLALPAETAK